MGHNRIMLARGQLFAHRLVLWLQVMRDRRYKSGKWAFLLLIRGMAPGRKFWKSWNRKHFLNSRQNTDSSRLGKTQYNFIKVKVGPSLMSRIRFQKSDAITRWWSLSNHLFDESFIYNDCIFLLRGNTGFPGMTREKRCNWRTISKHIKKWKSGNRKEPFL